MKSREMTTNPVQVAVEIWLMSRQQLQMRIKLIRFKRFLTLLMNTLVTPNKTISTKKYPMRNRGFICVYFCKIRQIKLITIDIRRYIGQTLCLKRFFFVYYKVGLTSSADCPLKNDLQETILIPTKYPANRMSPPAYIPVILYVETTQRDAPQESSNPLTVSQAQLKSQRTNLFTLVVTRPGLFLPITSSAKNKKAGTNMQPKEILKTEKILLLSIFRLQPNRYLKFCRGVKRSMGVCCPYTPIQASPLYRNTQVTWLIIMGQLMMRQIEAAHNKPIYTQTRIISILQRVQYDSTQATSSSLVAEARLTVATELIFESCTFNCKVLSKLCSMFNFKVRVELTKEYEIRDSESCRFSREGTELAGGFGEIYKTVVRVFEVLSFETDCVLKLQPILLTQTLGITELSQLKPTSSMQSAEHPSPPFLSPSSHCLPEPEMICPVPHYQQQGD